MAEQKMILELAGTYNRCLQNAQEMVHSNLVPVMFQFVIVPHGWYKFSTLTHKEECEQLPKAISAHIYNADGTNVRLAYLVQSELAVMQFVTILQMTKFDVLNISDFNIHIPKRRVYVR